MRERLQVALKRLGGLSDEALQAAVKLLSVHTLEKGTILLRAGEYPTHLHLVNVGWVREYYLGSDGKERTKGFALAGEFCGSLPDHLRGGLSHAFAVAGERTQVASVRYTDYQELCRQWPQWMNIHQNVVTELLLTKTDRERELLCLDALARYNLLIKKRPAIASLPQQDIASYLGITSVHLSRILRNSQAG